jgi:hypothetical protein
MARPVNGGIDLYYPMNNLEKLMARIQYGILESVLARECM